MPINAALAATAIAVKVRPMPASLKRRFSGSCDTPEAWTIHPATRPMPSAWRIGAGTAKRLRKADQNDADQRVFGAVGVRANGAQQPPVPAIADCHLGGPPSHDHAP